MSSWLPRVGSTSRFAKTITEADVGLFAGITGDFAPQHIDAEYMRSHPAGQRIAHGILTLGVASTAASELCKSEGVVAVSYGYDRLRFLRPVYLGDTVEARYTTREVDAQTGKVFTEVAVFNQRGEQVLAATHILFCYPPQGDPA